MSSSTDDHDDNAQGDTRASTDHDQVTPAGGGGGSIEEEIYKQQILINGKTPSWKKLKPLDSLDIESRKLHGHHPHASKGAEWSVILQLAFQSIGTVYGDIGTSPLYVYASTFTSGINHDDDILGVLFLIFYTLTLIPLIKYVLIVLRANDNGDGKLIIN